jgi:hypothetical protein
MSGIGKKIADGAGRAAKASARAAGTAAKKGAKIAVEKAPDFETFAKWLIRVATSLPKYLRLYFCLLTDNRVSSKAKVVLVTAVALLGSQFALGGVLFTIQHYLGYILGPFAFLPAILLMLLTLDICYTLISADILDDYQKSIFGENNSLKSDLRRMREFLGASYIKIKQRWQKKVDQAEEKMREDGRIVDGQITEETVQDVADQIVELETSDKMQQMIDKNVKQLEKGDAVVAGVISEVERKLLQ